MKFKVSLVLCLTIGLFTLPLLGGGCGSLNRSSTQPAPDMLQITAASNRAFTLTEKITADGLDLGLIPESDRDSIVEGAKVARRWLDQMGVDARANNQISFQNSLREFSAAVTPLIVHQVEVERREKLVSPMTKPKPR